MHEPTDRPTDRPKPSYRTCKNTLRAHKSGEKEKVCVYVESMRGKRKSHLQSHPETDENPPANSNLKVWMSDVGWLAGTPRRRSSRSSENEKRKSCFAEISERLNSRIFIRSPEIELIFSLSRRKWSKSREEAGRKRGGQFPPPFFLRETFLRPGESVGDGPFQSVAQQFSNSGQKLPKKIIMNCLKKSLFFSLTPPSPPNASWVVKVNTTGPGQTTQQLLVVA